MTDGPSKRVVSDLDACVPNRKAHSYYVDTGICAHCGKSREYVNAMRERRKRPDLYSLAGLDGEGI